MLGTGENRTKTARLGLTPFPIFQNRVSLSINQNKYLKRSLKKGVNMSLTNFTSQNDLLLNNLLEYYNKDDNLEKMLKIITGESKISLRIVDWFATNYSKKNFTLYNLEDSFGNVRRFKVYVDYKLKLKAYSKRRFDPFCRWERISIPYKNDQFIETTIGQLNFFKWTLENGVIRYIEENFDAIEKDMNNRNSTSKRKELNLIDSGSSKTRKKREELSVSACKCIKKESVKIIVKFN